MLVEGYFDHLALLRAGVEETVASMGTALTPEQTEKLRRLCERVVLCYDGDAAGRSATRTAIGLCLAQGLRVTVARLPEGEDPDDVLQSAPGRRRSPPGSTRRPTSSTGCSPRSGPARSPAAAAERSARIASVLELLREIPDSILRHEECRRLARAVSVPLEVLWDRIKAAAEQRSRRFGL